MKSFLIKIDLFVYKTRQNFTIAKIHERISRDGRSVTSFASHSFIHSFVHSDERGRGSSEGTSVNKIENESTFPLVCYTGRVPPPPSPEKTRYPTHCARILCRFESPGFTLAEEGRASPTEPPFDPDSCVRQCTGDGNLTQRGRDSFHWILPWPLDVECTVDLDESRWDNRGYVSSVADEQNIPAVWTGFFLVFLFFSLML